MKKLLLALIVTLSVSVQSQITEDYRCHQEVEQYMRVDYNCDKGFLDKDSDFTIRDTMMAIKTLLIERGDLKQKIAETEEDFYIVAAEYRNLFEEHVKLIEKYNALVDKVKTNR